MRLKLHSAPFRLEDDFLDLINSELSKVDLPSGGVILNFRSPDYSAENGGFRPVEIAVSPQGHLLYVTEFSYVGMGPWAELCKIYDFDFSLGLFGFNGTDHPLSEGNGLFGLWQSNFCNYHAMGVYTVEAQPLSE